MPLLLPILLSSFSTGNLGENVSFLLNYSAIKEGTARNSNFFPCVTLATRATSLDSFTVTPGVYAQGWTGIGAKKGNTVSITALTLIFHRPWKCPSFQTLNVGHYTKMNVHLQPFSCFYLCFLRGGEREAETRVKVKRGINLESLHFHKWSKSSSLWIPLTLT